MNILNMLFKVQIDLSQPQYFISTEVDRNTTWRQVSSGTHMVHQQRHVPNYEAVWNNRFSESINLHAIVIIWLENIRRNNNRKLIN